MHVCFRYWWMHHWERRLWDFLHELRGQLRVQLSPRLRPHARPQELHRWETHTRAAHTHILYWTHAAVLCVQISTSVRTVLTSATAGSAQTSRVNSSACVLMDSCHLRIWNHVWVNHTLSHSFITSLFNEADDTRQTLHGYLDMYYGNNVVFFEVHWSTVWKP